MLIPKHSTLQVFDLKLCSTTLSYFNWHKSGVNTSKILLILEEISDYLISLIDIMMLKVNFIEHNVPSHIKYMPASAYEVQMAKTELLIVFRIGKAKHNKPTSIV